MELFLGASWFNVQKIPYVYSLSCIAVNGAHKNIEFNANICLDVFIPERVLQRTGKTITEMKQGLTESDAVKLVHDIAEKATLVICYNDTVVHLFKTLSDRNKFKRKINAITLCEYVMLKSGVNLSVEEILQKYDIHTRISDRTSNDDCILLHNISKLIKQ